MLKAAFMAFFLLLCPCIHAQVVCFNRATAFFVSGNELLTAGHCIERSPEYINYNGRQYIADIVQPDYQNDIVKLRIRGYTQVCENPLKLSDKVYVGQKFKVCGFPVSNNSRYMETYGTVNRLRKYIRSITYKKTWNRTAVGGYGIAGHGQSGGPVIDTKTGLVIGVLTNGVASQKDISFTSFEMVGGAPKWR